MLFVLVMTIVLVTFVYKIIDMQYKIDQEHETWDWHIKD